MPENKRLQAVQVSGGLPGEQLGTHPETNLRLVTGVVGNGIRCRRIEVRAAVWPLELRQALCSILRRRHGFIVVPSPFRDRELLFVSQEPIGFSSIRWGTNQFQLNDRGEFTLRTWKLEAECALLASLLERALTVSYEQIQGVWRLKATRIWYSEEPADVISGIEVIPRIAFAALSMGKGAVAVAFDPGHLFRTQLTIADFFDKGLSSLERRERERKFHRLRTRSQRRNGTLLYDTGKLQVGVCYFVRPRPGESCGSVGPVMGHNSLSEYYRQKYPNLPISDEDSVVDVSFPGLPQPVPVAAKLLRLRIMPDKDPSLAPLAELKTMAPFRRREQIQDEWNRCRGLIVKTLGLEFGDDLWRPSDLDQELLPCPILEFGNGGKVAPPAAPKVEEYKRYYQDRMGRLKGGGIYRYEPSVERKVFLVTPARSDTWPDDLQATFETDIKTCLGKFVGAPFNLLPIREDDPERIVERLSQTEPGNAIIVFDDRKTEAAYYLLAHGLAGWRLKRLTRGQVESKWAARRSNDQRRRKAERRWQDMVALSVLDALDQMQATPWRIPEFPYEACLAIDVGEGRRYFGMSLLICRPKGNPSFFRVTRTWPKGDHQREEINAEILRDKIVEVFAAFPGPDFSPIASLLILRDGHRPGEEPRAIREGIDLLNKDRLKEDATVHVVDVHKKSGKNLRIWEATAGQYLNVLEGQAVYFPDGKTAVVCCTGRATLSPESTAEPTVLVASNDVDIRRATRAFFALAQLNYSSPAKAHRYALPLRESDARLQQRLAQDTRGVR